MQLAKNKLLPLKGKVQHYAWGGVSYLPKLLHLPNPENEPFAEYWLGAHENGEGELILNHGERIRLGEYIDTFKQDTLGATVADRFGRLPYLLKILDVKDMLSIQVHPSKKSAEKEFELENRIGIPLKAHNRNYKDDNHKPELMVALSEFWLLHGFKPMALLKKTLTQISEFQSLSVELNKGYAELYRQVMELPQEEVNKILQPLLNRIIPLYKAGQLEKDDENFWAARAALTFNHHGNIDRGIFSIYLFNLLDLLPGQAIFQDAGVPHAYLEGQNIEIMANSDNVLRGGLTSKHIAVEELMKHIKFEATHPDLVKELKTNHITTAFQTPAPDFELNRIELKKDETINRLAHSAEIYFLLSGKMELSEADNASLARESGEAWICFDQAQFALHAKENSTLFFAKVPLA
ncbi:MAG: mannose-6-phosphate isomerase, class I [Bacteroidetes bacterium]|nr:MAG: mannose-6-phosphate isomerase, class I [Bacteroidota bacterium]